LDGIPISLTGRRAVVTGASRGIGEGIARRLAAAGAALVLVARSEEPLRALAGELGATALVADLSDRAQAGGLADRVGPVDVLVNNAAIYQKAVPFLTEDDEYWQGVIDTNFWAPYVLMREFGRGMAERGHGSIVNITSISGQRAVPLVSHYSSMKAALDHLTRVAALELAGRGVRVNAVAPGFIETGHSGAMLDDAAREQVRGEVPLARSGGPEEVGDLVTFLASDLASYITGQVVACDGGSLSGSITSLRRYEAVMRQRQAEAESDSGQLR
jgi:NAD(P)-dependent dehydrogenase (short-subunit alcohol dehydrogenase family)